MARRERLKRKKLSNVEQLKAHHGLVLAVAHADDAVMRAKADFVMPIPRASELLTPILAVMPRVLLGLLAAGLVTAVHAEDWSLVGRHGECAPLRVLQRKLPDLPDVRSPEALAAYLDARRLRYSRRTVSIGRAQAVEFHGCGGWVGVASCAGVGGSGESRGAGGNRFGEAVERSWGWLERQAGGGGRRAGGANPRRADADP